MNSTIRVQLSGMMFLNYFIWGAWYVTMGTYLLQGLEFDTEQNGIAYGAAAIAAIISPFFVGMIADRFFPVEKVLGVIHLIGAGLLYWLTAMESFVPFYWILLLYCLLYMPTIALTNSISFHQIDNIEKEFPKIRAWGTIGWIMQGLLILYIQSDFSFGWFEEFPYFIETTEVRNIERTNMPFLIAAGASLLLGLYSFSLPNTPPKAKGQSVNWKAVIGLDALNLLKQKSFLVLFISSVLICIPLSFYYSSTNAFLNEVNFGNAAGKMTLGQMSEMLFLFFMPFFFMRLGVKKMILIGMAAWVLRYILFAYGIGSDYPGSGIPAAGEMIIQHPWMLYAGIILHGICYDFFFVTGQIYADNKAPLHLKSSVQGLMTFATYGVGMFIGTYLSGVVGGWLVNEDGQHDWWNIWMIPAVFSMLVLIFFLLAFKDDSKEIVEES